MNANELNTNNLMVGDWVRHINGTPYQVTCIKDGHFACSIPHLWEYNNKFGPIPITAEILKKNGFEYFLQSYHWKKEGEMPIKLRRLKSFWCLEINCDSIPVELRFVHELQHALRLCGIDKEIVL